MESILRKIHKKNEEHNIWSNQNIVIERLFKRNLEMQELYDELTSKLDKNQQNYLWDALLASAAHWSPDHSSKYRNAKKELTSLNQDIAKRAGQLADLMHKRNEISNANGFLSHEDLHITDWITKAGKNNHFFQDNILENLEYLSTRFDDKYWPNTIEVIDALMNFALEAKISGNMWTEELISSAKHSKADYLKVMLKAIKYRKIHGPTSHLLPKDFHLSDKVIATYINCSLDLDTDEMVDATYIKRSRQNIRDRQKKNL